MVNQRAQALVETMLIAPIIVFLMIGVFEIGWLLRGYLILVNSSREGARFAARPHYLDYTDKSYLAIVDQTISSIAGQLPFTETGMVIISVARVETQWVCDPYHLSECDCAEAVTNPFSPTLAMSPLTHVTATYMYPATSTEVTTLDIDLDKMIADNRDFNCRVQKRGGVPTIDTQVTVELFFWQDQLFGFPFISNPYTDPVLIRAYSTFRKVENSR